MTTLTLEDIKQAIIHRHENLLLDSVTITDSSTFSGNLELTIHTEDKLGRNLFLKQKQPKNYVLATPFMMEILALSSIVSSGKLKKDEAAVFASINNYTKYNDAKANTLITGETKRVSVKKEFLKYNGLLTHQNTPICEGSMTAYFNKIDFTPITEPVEDIDLTIKNTIVATKTDRHKQATMFLCDQLIKTSDTEIISQYTYPNDHPLIKGHFPKNPIMMGVMQWMTVEDALTVYLESKQLKGHHTWCCDAAIYNQHKVKVADIKQIKCESWINNANIMNQVEITATKRINFRSMVHPNDTLFTVINNLAQQ